MNTINICSTFFVALSSGHSQIYLAAVDKNREKAWDYYYITDRKW